MPVVIFIIVFILIAGNIFIKSRRKSKSDNNQNGNNERYIRFNDILIHHSKNNSTTHSEFVNPVKKIEDMINPQSVPIKNQFDSAPQVSINGQPVYPSHNNEDKYFNTNTTSYGTLNGKEIKFNNDLKIK